MGTQSNGSGVTDGAGWPSQTVFHAQPINNKMRGLKQKCHFFSNSSQPKLSRPPRESFKEILEEILGGNLECGSAQPSLFVFFVRISKVYRFLYERCLLLDKVRPGIFA